MMKKSLNIGPALLVCLLTSSSCITVGGTPSAGKVAGYRDLVTSKDEVFRMSQ
jgi:hypothetical protein